MKISLPCKNYTTSAAIILTHTRKIILCDQKRHFPVCSFYGPTAIGCDMKNIGNIFHLWSEISDMKVQ